MQPSSIRIVGISHGPAPEWVQRAWIGLELPLRRAGEIAYALDFGATGSKKRGLFQILPGLLAGKVRFVRSYRVDRTIALEALRAANVRAAEWYEKNTISSVSHVVFREDICERIGFTSPSK